MFQVQKCSESVNLSLRSEVNHGGEEACDLV